MNLYILLDLAGLPSHGNWKWLNPGPFNIKGTSLCIYTYVSSIFNPQIEHTAIVIMSSTASTVAVAMEIIAALGAYSLALSFSAVTDMRTLDLYYGIRLNGAVAMFQIFASQMIGYGIAGLRTYPPHAPFLLGYLTFTY